MNILKELNANPILSFKRSPTILVPSITISPIKKKKLNKLQIKYIRSKVIFIYLLLVREKSLNGRNS
jgi:hypothetical protein